MSDSRFARLRTDPRFRRIKKEKSKVIVDERFKNIFDGNSKKKCKARVDKYGRPLADNHDQENIRRFYRLGDGDAAHLEIKSGPDYARGAVLLQSSDEDEDEDEGAPAGMRSDDDSDQGGIVTLGRDVTQPIPVLDDSAEVDLDEETYADLHVQAAAFAQANPEADRGSLEIERTCRLAVVNLDWDHVRAIHLYKAFSSLVSPAPIASGSKDNHKSKSISTSMVRGKVLSVRVYPSEFGKERMVREEKEGPPAEVFKKHSLKPEEINERTVYELGQGEDYDEDALRKYQLERLRYYYAIVECDSVDAASHILNELDGTEFERSANVFDLSFVPEDMTFDEEFRDEATDDLSVPYKPLEFVTDALRHSKVKLTWDEDEPERLQVTRRVLTRKEIEENDFRAYVASSESEDEDVAGPSTHNAKVKSMNAAERDRLRALLLGGGEDTMPEGWGHKSGYEDDVDMEITFTPGLSGGKGDNDETTLERYQRKMREKKEMRKKELRERSKQEQKHAKQGIDDDFFGGGSDESADEVEDATKGKKSRGKVNGKKGGAADEDEDERPWGRVESTVEELALLAASDNPKGEVKHFDMKAVLRAEKKSSKKKRRGKKGADDGENEHQEDFSIDVKDDRFKAVLEDHTFAIDPSNPHFKKTKSMAALLEERSRRQQERASKTSEAIVPKRNDDSSQQPSLQSLIESVKRKSAVSGNAGMGKRRKRS